MQAALQETGTPNKSPAPCLQGFGGAADGAASPHRPASSSQPALVLYTNATVWTGDAAVPHAQAFLVDAATGRFSYVGERAGALAAAAAAASSAAPPHLQEVDLGGAHVIPGLIDSHLHLIPGGLSLSRLNLAAAGSRREFVGAVAAAAARLQPGQWLLGGGWDESHCCGGEMPTAAWIDAGEQAGQGVGRAARWLQAPTVRSPTALPAPPPPPLCPLPRSDGRHARLAAAPRCPHGAGQLSRVARCGHQRRHARPAWRRHPAGARRPAHGPADGCSHAACGQRHPAPVA